MARQHPGAAASLSKFVPPKDFDLGSHGLKSPTCDAQLWVICQTHHLNKNNSGD